MADARSAARRIRRAAFAFVLATIVVALVGACQLVAGIDDRSTGATTGASDATMTSDAFAPPHDGGPGNAAPALCKLTEIEDKPDADSPSSENVDVVAAITTFTLPGTPDSAAPPTLGYDLDGVCTCCDGGCATDNGASCRSTQSPHCDLAGGVDNVGGSLFADYVSLMMGTVGFNFTETALNQGIRTGLSTLVVRMKDWNNDDNDTSVELSFFPSNGTTYEDGGTTPIPPRFDGRDIWTYTPSSVLADIPDGAVPTDYPQFRSTSAYVRDRTLYARLDTLDLTFGDTALHLTEVKISASLSNVDGVTKLSNGIVAGRWPTQNILYRFGVGTLNPDCSITPTYNALKGLVCTRADVAASAANDGTGADDPATQSACNAISVTFGFTASTALLGVARPGVPVVTGCPTFADDCN